MKLEKRLIIVSVVLLSLCLVALPAQAGSKQQHRWEGVAIGVGAAVLGHALISSGRYGPHHGPRTYAFTYRSYSTPHRYDNGRWRRHGGDYDRHHRYHDRRHFDHRVNHYRPRNEHHRGHGGPGKAYGHRHRSGAWHHGGPGRR